MAALLGVSRQAISQRLNRAAVPVQKLVEIERIQAATGVTRHELRPDIYPPEEHVPASQPTAQVPTAHPSAPAPQAPVPSGADGTPLAPDNPGANPLEGMAA